MLLTLIIFSCGLADAKMLNPSKLRLPLSCIGYKANCQSLTIGIAMEYQWNIHLAEAHSFAVNPEIDLSTVPTHKSPIF